MNLQCIYSFSSATQLYTCRIGHVIVTDNVNQKFVFGGVHLSNRTDFEVTSVLVENATIPFIMSDMFLAFPNMVHTSFVYSGLTRLQPSAVINTRNVVFFTATRNQELNEIQSNAFAGASHLDILTLNNNNISVLHENAFVGLNRCTSINLANNAIRKLPTNVFWPLRRLTIIFLLNNQLETIDGRQFIFNFRMHNLNVANNRINAVQRNFLQSMQSVRWLNFQRNQCINAFFDFNFRSNETILEAFEPCFDNFDNLE